VEGIFKKLCSIETKQLKLSFVAALRANSLVIIFRNKHVHFALLYLLVSLSSSENCCASVGIDFGHCCHACIIGYFKLHHIFRLFRSHVGRVVFGQSGKPFWTVLFAILSQNMLLHS
jgi:hypothetical protein